MPPPSHPPLRLHLLGPFEVRDAHGATLEPPSRKGCALLALLAMPPGRFHTRERLATLLWPGSASELARASLRQALASIRRTAGADALQADTQRVALSRAHWWVDAERLAALSAGSAAGDEGGARDDALALYRGPFLEGWSLDGDEAADWLLFERTRCRQLAQTMLERSIDSSIAAGRPDDAIALAQRLLNLDPLREESHRRLMRLHMAGGDRAQALAQYEACKAVLSRDLGVSPSPETAALVREILAAREPAAGPGARPGSGPAAAAGVPAIGTAPRPTTAADRESVAIAVLPFASEADSRAVADGFAADLVTELSRIQEFHVIAWQSSLGATGRPQLATTEAAQLGARYALTGQLRRDGPRLRLSTQLIDAATHRWLWAERYDHAFAELFVLQDEIVARVAGNLDARLRHHERERAAQCSPDELDAWGLVHRAMWHIYRFTTGDIDTAQGLLERAIELTPASAAPAAALGYAWLVRAIWGWVPDTAAAVAQGLVQAERAVGLAPDDAFGHTVFGRLLGMAGRAERGLQHTQLAVELNPSFAPGHYGHALALTAAGRAAEGLQHARLALRLSPRDPLASMFVTAQALCEIALGEDAAAERSALRAIGLNPREVWARLALAASQAAQGRAAEAAGAIAELRRDLPSARLDTLSRMVARAPEIYRDRLAELLQQAGFVPGD